MGFPRAIGLLFPLLLARASPVNTSNLTSPARFLQSGACGTNPFNQVQCTAGQTCCGPDSGTPVRCDAGAYCCSDSTCCFLPCDSGPVSPDSVCALTSHFTPTVTGFTAGFCVGWVLWLLAMVKSVWKMRPHAFTKRLLAPNACRDDHKTCSWGIPEFIVISFFPTYHVMMWQSINSSGYCCTPSTMPPWSWDGSSPPCTSVTTPFAVFDVLYAVVWLWGFFEWVHMAWLSTTEGDPVRTAESDAELSLMEGQGTRHQSPPATIVARWCVLIFGLCIFGVFIGMVVGPLTTTPGYYRFC